MQALELKVPPPVIGLLIAAAMWGVSLAATVVEVPTPIRVPVAIAIALAGVGTAISGARAFRRAKTTVNPLKPETASFLVTSGVYRFTRNPMYLGLLMVVLGWAAFLCSALALLGPVAFVAYITRFQIVPEERVLIGLIGATYSEYQARVRRWL